MRNTLYRVDIEDHGVETAGGERWRRRSLLVALVQLKVPEANIGGLDIRVYKAVGVEKRKALKTVM
jgi:hypothetical protein